MLRRNWPIFVLLLLVLSSIALTFVLMSRAAEKENYDEIEPDLFLGGRVKTPPPETDAVLNVCQIKDPYQAKAHRWKGIRDGAPAPSLDWLREQVQFVDEQRRAGHRVFVHCLNGVSRSTMVVAAYLMRKHRWTRDEALAFIRKKRDVIRPNQSFMELLLKWEKQPHDQKADS